MPQTIGEDVLLILSIVPEISNKNLLYILRKARGYRYKNQQYLQCSTWLSCKLLIEKGLIKKQNLGHKVILYSITDKGKEQIKELYQNMLQSYYLLKQKEGRLKLNAQSFS